MTRTADAPDPAGVRPRVSWGLLPAAGVSASAVLLFGVQIPLAGYSMLVLSILAASFSGMCDDTRDVHKSPNVLNSQK